MRETIVPAQLASVLVYGPLRIAQRRLRRPVEYGVLHVNVDDPPGHAALLSLRFGAQA